MNKKLETITLKGHVHLTVRDARTGAIIPQECQEFDNLVVTAGKNCIADGLRLTQYTVITHCGVGSSTTVPALAQTDLISPIGTRVPIADAYRTGLVDTFSIFFGSVDCNGTWNEAGLFTALTGGTMMCRALFGSSFAKDTTKTATFDWTITIS